MMSAVGATTSSASVNGNNQIFTVSGTAGNVTDRNGVFKVRKFKFPPMPQIIALESFLLYLHFSKNK